MNMKKHLVLVLLAIMSGQSAIARTVSDNDEVKALENKVQKELSNVKKDVDRIWQLEYRCEQRLQQLNKKSIRQNKTIDSLQNICRQLSDKQTVNSERIKTTSANVEVNQSVLEKRTLWGGGIAIVILAVLEVCICLVMKRIKRGASSIDNVRKAQEALQIAQTKMQEEALSLDNKLIEIAEKQIEASSTSEGKNEIDHSLVLKVADEIVRIELNMSRMDSSIKGYKQLAKAVERIKDNFSAKGYEIVDMLGKTYTAGIKAAVTFVTDENLEEGQQVITKIIKPQINYQGKMIQSAQIEVSQSE